MLMSEKITQKVGFTRAKEMYAQLGDTEMVEFFEKRLAQLEKRSTSERKKTPRQIENDAYKQIILNGMTDDREYTTDDILMYFGLPVEIKYQRLSALMSQLIDDGLVSMGYDNKRVVHYKLVNKAD